HSLHCSIRKMAQLAFRYRQSLLGSLQHRARPIAQQYLPSQNTTSQSESPYARLTFLRLCCPCTQHFLKCYRPCPWLSCFQSAEKSRSSQALNLPFGSSRNPFGFLQGH